MLCCKHPFASQSQGLPFHAVWPSPALPVPILLRSSTAFDEIWVIYFFFLFAGKIDFLMGFFFQRVMCGFQPHPACPMLSCAQPNTRDLSAAMGRGWCWMSKALLPTCVWGQTQFNGISLCVCGLGSSCAGKPRSVSQFTVCVSSMSLRGFEKCL